jgi:hypothetical protein
MIGMLWRLAADSAPSQDDVLVAPDMLRWLANGASTPGRPADGALDLTLRVARDAVAAGEAPLDPLARWACATAPWQLRLLLDLFPQEELVPTAEQLVALLPERCWLRQHFQTSGLEPNRRDRFLVASLDFQDQSAEARGLEPDPAWAGTPLLAALRGSSVLEPAVLASALVVYARSDQERVALCHRYLEACARQERLAAEAVFAALFVPALLQSVTPAEADLLLRQLAVRTLPRWVPRRRVPVQPANPGDPLVSFTNGEFRLASGIRELLRKVVALVGVRRARGLLRAVLDEEVP